ncbi:MAG: efflux RND transporter periplasmic adaptor subunit [Brevinema sp.]
MNSKIKIGIVAVVLVIISFLVFRNLSQEKQEVRAVDNRTTVLVRKAEAGSLQRFLDLYGELKAENEVSLTSPVTGKVLRFNRLEGDTVRRNQAVVSIDRFEVGARYVAAPVTSPVNGVVTRILVSEGADVSIGTPVAMVGDINRLEASIQVPENYAPEIIIGQPVYFRTRAVPDRIFEGKIVRRDLSLNPDTRSLTVRAMIENRDHALFSGIFAESFVFIEEATNVFVVPESALAKTKEGQDAIFVNENETAILKPVEVVLRYRDQIAIGAGISEGEEMIVFGREYLSDGAPIRPLPEIEEEDQEIEELADQ